MRLLAALALLAPLGACNKDADDNFPVTPGGGSGTGSQFMPDAAVTGDGGTMISGRVCLLVADPLQISMCAASGAANLTVTLATATAQAIATALTADDGSFTIARPANTTGLVWIVSGAAVQRSAVQFSTGATLPAIEAAEYDAMLASINTSVGTGNGGLMMRVSRGGSPVEGATVAVDGVESVIFYDGPSALEWQTDATGPFGVAWAPNVPAGMVRAVITASAEQPPTQTTVPVFAGTLTFASAVVP